jgi:predicted DCC family thiol-disulfide oxidoreductase YuxK
VTIPVVHFRFGGVQEPRAGIGRPYTVIYDGTCRVCTRLAALLRRWDRRDELELVPYQNTTVLDRFPWIPAEAYAEAMQVVGPAGRTWQGADAVEQLLRILPWGVAIGWVFRVPGAGPAFAAFYRWFARNRYQFGCGEHCQARPLRVVFGEEEEARREEGAAG